MVLFQNLYLLVCIKFYICGYYNYISNLFLCHFSPMSRQILMLIKEEQKLLVKHSEILHQIIVSQTRNYFRLFFAQVLKVFHSKFIIKTFPKRKRDRGGADGWRWCIFIITDAVIMVWTSGFTGKRNPQSSDFTNQPVFQ